MARPSHAPRSRGTGDGLPDPREVVDLLFRRRAGQLAATLTRVFGIEHLDLVEDVVQDAFVRALRTWPSGGVPDNPGAWILTVAKNRALDALRRQGRWREKAEELERSILPEPSGEAAPRIFFSDEIHDDELRLIFATCHPALSRDAQVALTLKTACGFGTAEIARAFLTSRPTVAQRIVRAKRTIREEGIGLEIPTGDDLPGRLEPVLETLYLMFNEGYSATSGDDLVRSDLCAEAIRLVERVAAHPLVSRPTVHALAALFLFQFARLPARVNEVGELVLLDEQDRALWDRRAIRRALEHQRRSAEGNEITALHLQAEIAGCHALAPSFDRTDWARILGCYDALVRIDPSPVVALNRVVATAQVHGPDAGLRALQPLREEPALDSYDRLFAVEAELLWRAGQADGAERAVSRAISLAASQPVRSYLERRRRTYAEQLHARRTGS